MKALLAISVSLFTLCSAFSQKMKSDREDEGLNGKVKSVVTEGAKLASDSGQLKEGERKLKSIESYDTDGNITEKVIYDIGDKHVYTFIDGSKTVKITRFESGNNPPPAIVVGPLKNSNSKPRDSRYSYKFKYKYDALGNITEEAWYHNDGSLWLRYVSTFDASGNRTKFAQYRADGSLGFEITYKNDKGNIVQESWDYPDSDRYDHTNTYTYELDSRGNWIKRNNTKLVIRDGKTYSEPLGITYRKITYYPD